MSAIQEPRLRMTSASRLFLRSSRQFAGVGGLVVLSVFFLLVLIVHTVHRPIQLLKGFNRETKPCLTYPDPIREAIYSRPERDKIASEQCIGRRTPILANGAWCLLSYEPKKYYAPGRELSQTHYHTPEPVAKELMSLFQDKDVLDLGAGLGQFGHYFDEHGRKGKYTAFDGAMNIETFTAGRVFHGDLTKVLYFPTDWVLSLEVGEHIPKAFENQFMANVVRNARIGVVLSWAIPKQGGHGHVNEKSNEDVIATMEGLGFVFLKDISMKLREVSPRSHVWLRNTIMVFKRVKDVLGSVWEPENPEGCAI